MIPEDCIHVGVIGAAHALKGLMHLRPVDEPDALLRLERVYLESRGWMTVKRWSVHGPFLMLELAGVTSRDAAEELRGQKVYAEKALVPLESGRFYYHDLVGLPVRDPEGRGLGEVRGLIDAGAADLLEVQRAGKVYLVPLQAPYVQVRDGFIEIEPIPGLLEDE